MHEKQTIMCRVFLPFCREAAKQLILCVLYGKWKRSRSRNFRVPLTIDLHHQQSNGWRIIAV